MLQVQTQKSLRPVQGSRLTVGFARSMSEVLEAQRLRFRVFGEEMGARLPEARDGIDRDIFDSFCEHVLVRDSETNEVVGTYRILNGSQAKKLGGFYSDDEFDLRRINHLRDRMVEVGRSCVHPDYRTGAAIALLWSGLTRYMNMHRHEYLIGCASISIADGGHTAASVYRKIQERHLSPIEYRVFPRFVLPLAAPEQDPDADIPPLLNSYLRLGAYVCGDPAWDPDFNTADLFVFLPLSRLSPRYARHFLGAGNSLK